MAAWKIQTKRIQTKTRAAKDETINPAAHEHIEERTLK
jgi:hypothetical protein